MGSMSGYGFIQTEPTWNPWTNPLKAQTHVRLYLNPISCLDCPHHEMLVGLGKKNNKKKTVAGFAKFGKVQGNFL